MHAFYRYFILSKNITNANYKVMLLVSTVLYIKLSVSSAFACVNSPKSEDVYLTETIIEINDRLNELSTQYPSQVVSVEFDHIRSGYKINFAPKDEDEDEDEDKNTLTSVQQEVLTDLQIQVCKSQLEDISFAKQAALKSQRMSKISAIISCGISFFVFLHEQGYFGKSN